MNEEKNFLNNTNEDPAESPDVLTEEPSLNEEYPSIGGYNRDDLIAAIREARE